MTGEQHYLQNEEENTKLKSNLVVASASVHFGSSLMFSNIFLGVKSQFQMLSILESFQKDFQNSL